MEIKTKRSLDALSEKSVTVKTRRYLEENGEEISVGDLHAKGYVNTEKGRETLKAELEEPFLSAVMAVWGEHPQIFEEVTESVTEPTT